MKTIKVLPNADDVNAELRLLIQQSYDSCETNFFTIGLSGGSIINSLTKTLPTLTGVDWRRWRLFFCDERIVPFNDPESTFGCYWKAFENVIPLQKSQFIVINPSLDGEAAAQDYFNKIVSLAVTDGPLVAEGLPKFNLLLLGMGPDGHTASLFPNHSLLEETSKWVAYIGDSPKPPPKRVTLTYPVINNADSIIFICTGISKAEILKKIFVDGDDYPAGRVQPNRGELIWLLDKAAGSLLPKEMIGAH